MARRTYLVGIRENACQSTFVDKHFGGLWLPSSVNGEGSHWPLKRLTTSVCACVVHAHVVLSHFQHTKERGG